MLHLCILWYCLIETIQCYIPCVITWQHIFRNTNIIKYYLKVNSNSRNIHIIIYMEIKYLYNIKIKITKDFLTAQHCIVWKKWWIKIITYTWALIIKINWWKNKNFQRLTALGNCYYVYFNKYTDNKHCELRLSMNSLR